MPRGDCVRSNLTCGEMGTRATCLERAWTAQVWLWDILDCPFFVDAKGAKWLDPHVRKIVKPIFYLVYVAKWWNPHIIRKVKYISSCSDLTGGDDKCNDVEVIKLLELMAFCQFKRN